MNSGTNTAELAIRLLLDRPGENDLELWRKMAWPSFIDFARKNVILIRTQSKLSLLGIQVDEEFEQEVRQEKDRVSNMLRLIGNINEACVAAEINFVLIKAFLHYPDMGGDIDLVTADSSRAINTVLTKAFGRPPLGENLLRRISGESAFFLEEHSTLLEIHHGRLGLAGEHPLFPRLMVAHRKTVSIDGVTASVPQDEDRLLSQVLHRMYGHFYIRISDFIDSVSILRSRNLDWSYLNHTAGKIGITEALCVYVGFINAIYQQIFNEPLPTQEWLVAGSKNNYEIFHSRSYYRYPMLPVTCSLYLHKIASDMVSGNLYALAKMSLMPLVVLCRLAGNMGEKKSRYFEK